ncbi:MAG: DUF4388 domain-containing protein [Nitrospiraceae bacterium]|nr:DUF4388 domain-containing protein [Nitrospiraceae bacterium]
MALEGSLSDFGLADILQLIYFQRKTGVLTLDGRMDRVKLLFVEGNISGAESKRRVDDNRLGKILLKKGLIQEGDLQAALAEHKKSGEKLGNILIKREMVARESVTEVVNSQITETVIQLFNWKEGTYEFKAQRLPQDNELSFSLDTQHLLMEGLRIVDEWSVIKGRVSLDMVFRAKEETPEDLSEEEEAIFRYVDGENDVSTIIDISGRDNFQVSKTLLALMERGIVEAAEAAAVEAMPVETAEARKRKTLPFFRFLVPATLFISLMLSVSIVAVRGGGPAKEFRAAAAIDRMRNAIETYKILNSAYPASLDLVSRADDPWGRPYVYRVSGGSFSLVSAGSDGKEGTADDIE